MRLPVDSLLAQCMSAPEMRSVNGIQLLNLVRERGPVSRAMLARLSNLSKPAVSEQIQRLIRLGVVVETGPGDVSSTGGKRPTMVAFNADAGRVAGIGIGAETTHLLIADLRGDIRSRTEMPTQPERGARRLIERIVRVIGDTTVRAVGIGVPGRVDCTSGALVEAGGVFDWSNVDLRTPLALRFGCPVQVDNDVNLALLAESYHGAARGADTAVLVSVGTGVGAAVLMKGALHHGAHWAAGELGHLALDRERVKQLGGRGQLEMLVGAQRVVERVRAAARRSAVLRRLLREADEMTALFQAAKERDAAAGAIARDVAYHVSVAVAHQVLAYDPDVVLVSGEIFGHVLGDVRKFLARTAPWCSHAQRAALGGDAVALGGVDAAVIAVYEEMSRRLSARAASVSG